jgi:hypothetical protein
MIFATAAAIGVFATGLRSVLCYALISVMLMGLFAAAALTASTHISIMALAMAIAGYNAGIVAVMSTMILARRVSRSVSA